VLSSECAGGYPAGKQPGTRFVAKFVVEGGNRWIE